MYIDLNYGYIAMNHMCSDFDLDFDFDFDLDFDLGSESFETYLRKIHLPLQNQPYPLYADHSQPSLLPKGRKYQT